ncbi:hypothetical protein BGX31_002888, partial [Mortierella sp. GBA43]
GDKDRGGEDGTEHEETEDEKEWAVVDHHRDTNLAVKVAFEDLKGNKNQGEVAGSDGNPEGNTREPTETAKQDEN